MIFFLSLCLHYGFFLVIIEEVSDFSDQELTFKGRDILL